MQHKTVELLETKADEQTGTFTALASVFGNVDKGGDRMMPGSFANTLERWRQSGKAIPVILSHQWDNLSAWVGKADPRAVFEDERGLVVQGQLDMEDESARKVHKLMREGLLTGWSFGYTVPKGGQRRGKDGANEVTEVELFEIGPTLVGMNPEAQLQSVKSDSGKELIAADELKGVEEGVLTAAVWSSAFVNDLPDSSFLYVEPGGEKDGEGKTTPRSLRHFPVKGPDGAVDLPHLRNALARIPQSNLPQNVKDRLTATAQRMLDNANKADDRPDRIEDAPDEEPAGAKRQAQDPLSHGHADRLAFELATSGIDLAEPPKVKAEPTEQPSMDELRRQSYDLMLDILTGSEV